jgi:hypothetical protein
VAVAGLEAVVVGAEVVELVERGVAGAGPVLFVVDLEPGTGVAPHHAALGGEPLERGSLERSGLTPQVHDRSDVDPVGHDGGEEGVLPDPPLHGGNGHRTDTCDLADLAAHWVPPQKCVSVDPHDDLGRSSRPPDPSVSPAAARPAAVVDSSAASTPVVSTSSSSTVVPLATPNPLGSGSRQWAGPNVGPSTVGHCHGIAGQGDEGVGVVGLGRFAAAGGTGVTEDPFAQGRQRSEQHGLVFWRKRPGPAAGALVVGPGAQVATLPHPGEPLLRSRRCGAEPPPPSLQLAQRLAWGELQQVRLRLRHQ